MWQSKREISRECNDIIGSAKGSQISEKYWSEVGKGKRADGCFKNQMSVIWSWTYFYNLHWNNYLYFKGLLYIWEEMIMMSLLHMAGLENSECIWKIQRIFRLFVILSLTQLYRYTPEIFLLSTATFKYTYRAPLRRIGQECSANVAYFIFICIRNSLDRPCVTMPSWSSPLKCKVSHLNTDNCSNADYKNMFNSKLLTFDF
jgi:hypothetical protein